MRRRSPSSELVPVAAPRDRGTPIAARLLFAPVRLVERRLAPRLSARLFASVWRVVDDGSPPPRAEEPQLSVGKLALALALEGACNAIVRGLLDHGSRRQFARITGRWPSRAAKP